MLGSRARYIVLFSLLGFVLTGCGGGSSGSVVTNAIECVTPEPLNFPQPSISGPQIGGVIEIEANARVDRDTAELIEEFGQPVLSRAERIPSAVILGGYVSAVSGTYEDESGILTQFRYPADPQDRYCIDLQPGQRVNVEFFVPVIASRVRLLRASDGAVVDAVEFSTGQVKQVVLPTDAAEDTYVIDIEAQAQSGPGRYVLSSSAMGNAQNLDWASGEFVPGEAVVTLSGTPGVSAQSVTFEAQMSLARPLGNGQHKAVMPATLMAQAGSLTEQKNRTLEWVRKLRQRPDVISASPNYIFRALAVAPAFEAVGEPLYDEQWHYPLINMPQAWQLVPGGGEGIEVAVLDTGIFRYGTEWHEDLAPNLPICGETTCIDFVDEDFFPEDPGSAVGGSVYHGTHVAGTVAASGFNETGGTGVAPSATILPVRVLDENGSGSLDDVVEAINWSVANGADVINLSLGSPADPDALLQAVNDAAAAGVLVVAAAGNSPNEQLVYPAAFESVFGVGAVDGAGVLAGYSNIGGSADLSAPGGDASRDANQDGVADVVISASGNASPGTGGFTYAGLQGTSMATPHVAGVFALMKQLKADLETRMLMALLGEITTGPEAPGYGAGIIDAAKAVQAVSSGSLTLLSAAPILLEFKDGSAQETLVLDKVGDLEGSVTLEGVSVEEDDSWLRVGTPSNVEGGFTVPVSVDRTLLEPGRAYRSELTVAYRSNGTGRSLTVPVIVPVESPIATREAGVHFVLLIDDQNRTVAQTSLSSTGGTYNFAFEVVESTTSSSPLYQVTEGSYYLIAGTDLDNNGIICAVGEACAEYPIAGLREKITVVLNGDGTASVVDQQGQEIIPDDLVMTTSFSRPLSAQSLPRPGFEGYKLLESAHQYAPRTIAE